MNQNNIEKFFFKIGQHSFLIALAVMFSFPFIWMIAASGKVDREMFGEQRTLFPRAPKPALISPYTDVNAFPEPSKPEEINQEDYDRLKESLSSVIYSAVTNANILLPERFRDNAEKEITQGLWKRLIAITPYSYWTNLALNPEKIAERATRKKEIKEILNQCYRKFSIRLSRVRDDDMTVYNLEMGKPVTSIWSSLNPEAAFLEEQNDQSLPYADIHYSFEKTNEIDFQAEFDIPFAASNLLQFCIAYRPDDSWHRMYVEVEGGGKKYVSTEAVYLFDYTWSGVNWQKPSEQDAEIKIKRWTKMKLADEGKQFDFGKKKIRVKLILKQSSLLQAWIGKLSRNYLSTFKYVPFWRYIGTSAFLVILNIIGTLFSSTVVAYAFSRLRWPGRDVFFLLLLATLMIPPQVTLIPGFIIMKWLGWYNTLQPLWVFSFCGNAFYIFLLRQFMKGIPNDLEDAAKIDGCGFLRIYWYVVLPLIKPTMAAIAIFTFMGVWNDFMGPLIFLSDHRLYPLSLGLFSLNVQAGGNFGMMMAGSFLMTLPVIIIFFFAQKYFIQGITLTGMKG
jgi:ABC-type glycerol-3-phosphate transport system permease component